MASSIRGASSGAPSLSPQRRAAIDRLESQRERTSLLASEASTKAKAAVAPDGERPNNEQANLGIPLQGHQITERLMRLNSQLWFEVANADHTKLGCYLLTPRVEGGKQFIAGFEKDMNPEFTTKLEVEGRVVVKRGYRTLLMRLIKNRLVTESGCAALFGEPSKDSKNWAVFVK